jgi:hypothetical protein
VSKRAQSVSSKQVAAFRLARHHLLGRYAGKQGSASLAQAVGDVAGIRAQVMSAAELALWTRMHGLTRAEVQSALWKDRVLVKTSCMRQTLHILPSGAVRKNRSSAILNQMAKFGMTAGDAEMLSKNIAQRASFQWGGPLRVQVPRDLSFFALFRPRLWHLSSHLPLDFRRYADCDYSVRNVSDDCSPCADDATGTDTNTLNDYGPYPQVRERSQTSSAAHCRIW